MLALQREQIVVKNQSSAECRPGLAGKTKRCGFAIQRFLKGCIDLFTAGGLIILLMPLFVLLSLLILMDDGRPVIYRRRVVGRKGEFDAFKFRSMRRDADATLEGDLALKAKFQQHFKLKSDPRLTRSGSYLRKLSLDELPQLFNVLKG